MARPSQHMTAMSRSETLSYHPGDFFMTGIEPQLVEQPIFYRKRRKYIGRMKHFWFLQINNGRARQINQHAVGDTSFEISMFLNSEVPSSSRLTGTLFRVQISSPRG